MPRRKTAEAPGPEPTNPMTRLKFIDVVHVTRFQAEESDQAMDDVNEQLRHIESKRNITRGDRNEAFPAFHELLVWKPLKGQDLIEGVTEMKVAVPIGPNGSLKPRSPHHRFVNDLFIELVYETSEHERFLVNGEGCTPYVESDGVLEDESVTGLQNEGDITDRQVFGDRFTVIYPAARMRTEAEDVELLYNLLDQYHYTTHERM